MKQTKESTSPLLENSLDMGRVVEISKNPEKGILKVTYESGRKYLSLLVIEVYIRNRDCPDSSLMIEVLKDQLRIKEESCKHLEQQIKGLLDENVGINTILPKGTNPRRQEEILQLEMQNVQINLESSRKYLVELKDKYKKIQEDYDAYLKTFEAIENILVILYPDEPFSQEFLHERSRINDNNNNVALAYAIEDYDEMFLCQIGQTLNLDPVILPCGHSYDRFHISKYIDQAKNKVCPLCNASIIFEPISNLSFKAVINRYSNVLFAALASVVEMEKWTSDLSREDLEKLRERKIRLVQDIKELSQRVKMLKKKRMGIVEDTV